MAKTDPELGARVYKHLTELGLETKIDHFHPRIGDAHTSLYNGVQGFLGHMGLDINDPSIQDTPTRVAEMFAYELCAGLNYDNFPKCTTTPNGIMLSNQTVVGKVDEMVMVRKIRTVTLCEHHFQTISGYTWIAYIPSTQLLGLSKFARVTNFFARRPQVQERMTEQLYAALAFILETPDVAVYQAAVHNCMRARGVMDPESDTITSKMGGRFLSNAALRQEFLNAVH